MTIHLAGAARRQIAKGLVSAGIPAEEASLTADVAVHAAEQAIATLQRSCEPLDGRAWTNAYSIALQSLQAMTTTMFEDMKAKADGLGMASRAFAVDTRQ